MLLRRRFKFFYSLLLVALPFLAFVIESSGSDQFIEHPIAQNYSSNPGCIQAIDMDNDNDLDVVVSATSWGSGDLAWWENDGDQNFTEHTVSTDANWWGHFARDMDGDGDIDILANAGYNESSDYRITLWENHGNQMFSPLDIASDWDQGFTPYPVDMDNDGDQDIVVNDRPDTLSWFENIGSLMFTEHTIDPTFGTSGVIYASDLDGDNDVDILTHVSSSQDLAWWENDGSQGFTKHVITSGAGRFSDIDTTDLDGDGDQDMVATIIGGAGGNRTSWLENDGAQNFTEHTIANTSHPVSVCIHDMDADGDKDVVGTDQYSNEVSWWENDGNQMFTRHIIKSNYSGAHSGIVAEMNGDYKPDVLATAYWGKAFGWWESLIPQIDTDGDGIHNEVDEDPLVSSKSFSDVVSGGRTSGQIVSLDTGITIEIMDAPDPADGVKVVVAGGSGGIVKIKIDGSKGIYKLEPGEYILTYSSVTLQVIDGKAEVEFTIEGVLIVVSVEGTVTLEEVIVDEALKELVVNAEEGIVTVNGEVVAPGEIFTFKSVSIDIKPGSDPNCFNNDGHGVIPVAILSSHDFDATRVDPSSVSLDGQSIRIVGKGKTLAHIEDANGDGLDDLVVQIEDEDGIYQEGDTLAIIMGDTFDGISIVGTDAIRIVP